MGAAHRLTRDTIEPTGLRKVVTGRRMSPGARLLGDTTSCSRSSTFDHARGRLAPTIVDMTSPDPFRDLLDLVQESLSEPELTGADLAGRAFLSQFHFNRLVKASLGEPPGAFRRRLLLERAAYRLQSSADSVLTVPLDVGYGSSEAFSRAFTRAFGHAPSEHRAGGACLIDGPSGIHFHPPGGLVLPTPRRSSGMDLIARMLDHHLWLSGEILDRSGTLPDSVLDDPITLSVDGIDESPTLRSLGARLVTQLGCGSALWMGPRRCPSPATAAPQRYVPGWVGRVRISGRGCCRSWSMAAWTTPSSMPPVNHRRS